MERLSHILVNIWDVKVNNSAIPTDIINIILSFCSRKTLMRIVITNKQLYDLIPIDQNQENVAKNGDMFSLLKIAYSPDVVVNIAARNNNVIMVDYLLDNHFNLLGDELYESIGFSGNEFLLDKINHSYQLFYALVGFYQGSHMDLLEKYVPLINFNFRVANNQRSYINTYKNMLTYAIIYNFSDEQIKKYINKYLPHDSLIGMYEEQKIFVYCATQSMENVKIYIESLHDKFMERRAEKDKKKSAIQFSDSVIFLGYFWKEIYFVLKGLIYGGHYELFVWFQNKYGKNLYYPIYVNETHYTIYDDDLIIMLIKNNNFQLFSLIISDYYEEVKKENHNNYYFQIFVKKCIDYKRLNMLEFLFTNIEFSEYDYRNFHEKSLFLKFKDVTDIIIKYAKFEDKKINEKIHVENKKDIIPKETLNDNTKSNGCIIC